MTYWDGTRWIPDDLVDHARKQARPRVRPMPALLVALATLVLTAGSVFAAKSAATLVVQDGVFGGTSVATVQTLATTARTAEVSSIWLQVQCTVDADGSAGLVAWEPTNAAGQAVFTLGPTPSWQGGSAHCQAVAGNFDRQGRFKATASATFTVWE